jgi:aspartyl-tRNA synthetase
MRKEAQEPFSTSLRTHTCGALTGKDAGKRVMLIGWVNRKRDHGGLSFIDLRDRFGTTQIVIHPEKKREMETVREIKNECVVSVSGTVQKRPTEMVNKEMKTGEIEVEADTLDMVNPSLTPPFVIEEAVKAQEELKLKYRYLDLRRRIMLHHLKTRHAITQSIREYLVEQGFLEIETPILAKATPEGARDFLVPSREEIGKFYALAQSPQMYKQILMVAGVDRYFQFAKCLRDEDMRGDRQPEHTQIDIEMSFVTEEDIYTLCEAMFQKLFRDILSIDIETPFPRITYRDAMEIYGCDRPDLRIPLIITDYTHAAKTGKFRVFNESMAIKGIKVNRSFSRKHIDELEMIAKKAGARGLLWIAYDEEYRGPFVKHFDDLSVFKMNKGDILFLIAGERKSILPPLSELRKELGKEYLQAGDYKCAWVTHFPLFEWNDETKSLDACHHIFTMPVDENLDALDENPGSALGRQYDIVINGVEIASGSIRNHDAEIQRKLLKMIGLNDTAIDARFGFLLNALQYGAPPHGGIAPGIDRICMILEGTDTIRDVIAFPKTLTKKGLLEETPSEVEQNQLDELHIEIKEKQTTESTE